MPSNGQPILTIQTASLWASGAQSGFTGTGGPQGFDPFLGTFAGVVSSAGLATTAFSDSLFGVDAGDQVTFVIAIQNFANAAAAYGLIVYDAMPAGFMQPGGGAGVTISDGAGNLLAAYGDLFDPDIGLIITSPVAPYSDTSGANVVLITFTLQATNTLIAPAAQLSDTAQITAYSASSGGANLASGSTTPLSASTSVVTGTPSVASAADQAPAPLASGQTDSFDVTVTMPEGVTQNVAISELLTGSGGAALRLVSAQVVSVGANLSTTLPAVVQADGSVQLGRVTDTPDNVVSSADQVVLRLTVANGGTAAGTATLTTTVSAANPNNANQSWSTSVANTVTLATPDTPPTISGASANQITTNTVPVLPLAGIVFTDPDQGQTQTLTIHLSDTALGTLSGSGLGRNASGDATLTGSVAAVQAAARALVFTPAANATGVETFSLTIDDGASGVATNASTALTIAQSAHSTSLASYPISSQTVLTSSATGTTTVAQAQTYQGPADNIQGQFLYDGAGPIAIVAQQSGMMIGSGATATAVQLQGGTNVVNLTAGSGFVTSSNGSDSVLLQASASAPTWSTVANFHAGDAVTIYGVHGSSDVWWVSSAGAAGYTGATLRIDVNNDGVIDSSVTFAGKTLTEVNRFGFHTGTVGGLDYLQLTA